MAGDTTRSTSGRVFGSAIPRHRLGRSEGIRRSPPRTLAPPRHVAGDDARCGSRQLSPEGHRNEETGSVEEAWKIEGSWSQRGHISAGGDHRGAGPAIAERSKDAKSAAPGETVSRQKHANTRRQGDRGPKAATTSAKPKRHPAGEDVRQADDRPRQPPSPRPKARLAKPFSPMARPWRRAHRSHTHWEPQ